MVESDRGAVSAFRSDPIPRPARRTGRAASTADHRIRLTDGVDRVWGWVSDAVRPFHRRRDRKRTDRAEDRHPKRHDDLRDGSSRTLGESQSCGSPTPETIAQRSLRMWKTRLGTDAVESVIRN